MCPVEEKKGTHNARRDGLEWNNKANAKKQKLTAQSSSGERKKWEMNLDLGNSWEMTGSLGYQSLLREWEMGILLLSN